MGFRRRLMMAQRQGGGSRALPAGYTPLMYVQPTSANTYINTGINASSDIRIKCKCQWNVYPTDYEWVFGARDSDSTHQFEMFSYTNYTNSLRVTGLAGTGYSTSVEPFAVHEYDISQQRIIVDGIEYPNTTGDQSSWSINRAIYLFALNGNGSVYYNSSNTCKLFDHTEIYNGTTLVRDYQPCIDTNSVRGLYDHVSQTFFAPSTGYLIGQEEYPLDAEGYRPYLWLNGDDDAVSSNWVDRILGTRWSLTGATHGDDYYEFLNPTSGAATKYAGLSRAGRFVNLGTKWKVEIDAYIDGDSMRYGYFLDMCAYGTTSTNYRGLGFGLSSANASGLIVNTKPSGNTAITQNNVSDISPITYASGWTLYHYKWICEDGNSGYSVNRIYFNGEERRYTDEYTTVEWKDFRNNSSPNTSFFISRGSYNTSSTNTAIRGRIKSIKISIKE